MTTKASTNGSAMKAAMLRTARAGEQATLAGLVALHVPGFFPTDIKPASRNRVSRTVVS